MVGQKEVKQSLEGIQAWELVETDIDDVYITMTGSKGVINDKSKPMVVVFPTNPATQKPYKRKGVFLANHEYYSALYELLNTEEVSDLIKVIEKMQPKKNKKSGSGKKLKIKK